jgi:hypothetical protein
MKKYSRTQVFVHLHEIIGKGGLKHGRKGFASGKKLSG